MEVAIQIFLNGLIAAAVYVLMAMAFNLVYGVGRFFHIALGAYGIVGGYAMLSFFRNTDLPVWFAIICSSLIAGVVGWLCDIVIFRQLRKQKASSLIQLVASLGLFLLLQAVIAMIYTPEYQSYPVSLAEGVIEIGGGIMTKTQVVMFIIACVCYILVQILMRFTKYGRAIRAVRDDAEVATVVGINTERVIGLVIFLASALAGLAGILTGFDVGLSPTGGLPLLLKGAIAGVIGGLGTIPGAFLGALLLSFVENIGVWYTASQWRDAVAFAVLIVFLIFRPRGVISNR